MPQVKWGSSSGSGVAPKEIEQLAEVLEAASFELENKANEIVHMRAVSSDMERRSSSKCKGHRCLNCCDVGYGRGLKHSSRNETS